MAPDRASNLSDPLTTSTTHSPDSPSNSDLSRRRLKEITKWIRDELDLQVAREGPDVLRPDDVLTLHETFLALQNAHNISISDLRATGIHKAVQEIAGVATRWPSRLCDDCDKIIDIWTAKFGPLSAIHPFLYGRGGRLEGIASVHEQSRDALLKRWARTCPEKIHPKRSHKLGDLGFTAGSWWISPLFAHHAGIIGLESCDGGTTYDKHGAYALLLKDTGELEASSESRFTYRVPQNDKGKFRLTAATPRSRDPVRVLRSHSINSIWGPKAGVRYEGLFSVKGWSIRQAKSSDTSGGRWKAGDILFDVKFERIDQTPMEVVINRPTATELDDYAEYKRLRKLHHNAKQEEAKAIISIQDSHPVFNPAPIMPLLSPLVAPTPLLLELPPSEIRKGMVKRLHFDEEPQIHVIADEEALSPKTAPSQNPLNAVVVDTSTMATPSEPSRRNDHKKFDPSSKGPVGHSSPIGSKPSSMHTTGSTKPKVDIREVAPWIDFDADLTIPTTPDEPLIVHQRPIITQAGITSGLTKAQKINSSKPRSREHLQVPVEVLPFSALVPRSEDRHERKKNGETKGLLGEGLHLLHTSKKDKRKTTASRSLNIMSKLFDGMSDDEDELDGSMRHALEKHATSWMETLRLHPHVVRRASSTNSLLKLGRRNSICDIDKFARDTSPAVAPDNNSAVIVVAVSYEDPFIETPALRRPKARPMSMKNPISRSSLATTVGSATCTSVLGRSGTPPKHAGKGSLAEIRLRKMLKKYTKKWIEATAQQTEPRSTQRHSLDTKPTRRGLDASIILSSVEKSLVEYNDPSSDSLHSQHSEPKCAGFRL